jgi:hypothetical protein
MRKLQVTVTLDAAVPPQWHRLDNETIKSRAEEVARDALRRVFFNMEAVSTTATATVEGGDHE